ncbi:hypothetical protein [Caldanaerobius polysaccharolyticus]|uniref:hypothetical protein n=1 Tax=Caldanaerobius polysaccharolyticus TaxID=44256 RepID=UPI000479111C|nr:hypothetical protein [Caldanaerobius polysaccharolyticus]
MTITVVVLAASLVGVVAFLVYREWYHAEHIERLEKRYFDERQMLLDRVMARDFVEYKQGEVATRIQEQTAQAQAHKYNEDFDWSRLGE